MPIFAPQLLNLVLFIASIYFYFLICNLAAELFNYKEEHFKDRSKPKYFLHYLVCY